MSGVREIVVVEDAAALAEEGARRVTEAAEAAVAERGRFIFVLSGGSTPRHLYETLAAEPWRSRVDWEKTLVFFGDERCVPPDHPQSNYAMAMETLLSRVPIPPRNVRRMASEVADHTAAAASYEAEMRGIFDVLETPAFDVVLLGIGPDGHTASLFPGTAALEVTDRWVTATHIAQLEAWRLTFTYPALAAARRLIFLASGADKAAVVALAFGDTPRTSLPPAGRVALNDGRVEVLLDRAAAAYLK